MKSFMNKHIRLLCLLLIVSLMLTGCALLPTSISDTLTGQASGGTVTISQE